MKMTNIAELIDHTIRYHPAQAGAGWLWLANMDAADLESTIWAIQHQLKGLRIEAITPLPELGARSMDGVAMDLVPVFGRPGTDEVKRRLAAATPCVGGRR